MLLHQKQNEVASDLHRFRVLRCGRQSGKTTLAVEEIKAVALSKPSVIYYFATTHDQAREICWEMLKKGLGGMIISANNSLLEAVVRTQQGGESIVRLKGWENVETMRGKQADLLVLDEVASMKNFWTNWNEVLTPVLSFRKGEGLFLSTPKGFNHFYDLCNLELTNEEFKSFHFTSYDNPFLAVDEIEKAKARLNPEQFLQEYMASFQKTSGLVYKEFSRSKHLYDELPQGNFSKIAGIDFGYTHPAAVLDIRTNGELYFVEDEWVKTGRTEIQIAEYVAANNFEAVYPDPESPSAIEELRRKNINVREVIKGKDSVVSGIQKVRELLINGRLKINKKCVNTIANFEMYVYDENKDTEKPLKENDDCLDSLRYTVTMSDFKPQLVEAQRRHFEIKQHRIAQDSTK